MLARWAIQLASHLATKTPRNAGRPVSDSALANLSREKYEKGQLRILTHLIPDFNDIIDVSFGGVGVEYPIKIGSDRIGSDDRSYRIRSDRIGSDPTGSDRIGSDRIGSSRRPNENFLTLTADRERNYLNRILHDCRSFTCTWLKRN